jgi:hypothetical protein
MNADVNIIIAKRIMENRKDSQNKDLHLTVRACYLDFARNGEEILIAEANRIIKYNGMFGLVSD